MRFRPVGRRRSRPVAVAVTLVALGAALGTGCGSEARSSEAVADVLDLRPGNTGAITPEAEDFAAAVVALEEYCERLDAEEVAEVVGSEATGYEWIDRQCVYELRGDGPRGRLYLSMSSSSDGPLSFYLLRGALHGEREVDGVGDEAVFVPDTTSLHVRDGDRNLFLQLLLEPAGEEGELLARLERLAQLALGSR